jgi:positive regulator of sigma E activity
MTKNSLTLVYIVPAVLLLLVAFLNDEDLFKK